MIFAALVGTLYKAEASTCSWPTREADNAGESPHKRLPKGSAKSALCFVELYLLRMLSVIKLAAPKTLFARTKFNHQRPTDPRKEP
ncbi:hypothetical protein RN22_23735 [Grimontia sp. AD028]|nr:hypothetical protein RN22_23735 [Grimontia sp. AD028]